MLQVFPVNLRGKHSCGNNTKRAATSCNVQQNKGLMDIGHLCKLHTLHTKKGRKTRPLLVEMASERKPLAGRPRAAKMAKQKKKTEKTT